MANKQPMNSREFGRFATDRARIKGYDLATADGRTRLAKDTGVPVNDINAIKEGRYRPPVDPWKIFGEVLGEKHKDMLRIVGILAPGSQQKKSTRDIGIGLGIKKAGNLDIFEALVAALLKAER